MIDEKIIRYKNNIEQAQKLLNHNFADKVYYEDLIQKMRKILYFYETLHDYRKKNDHPHF